MVRRLIPVLAIATALAMPAAALSAQDVQRCNAMAATLTPKKAELESLTAKRDALAVEVETLGDAWEEAEAMRNFSSDGAAKADVSKSDYDRAKAQLMRLEQGLQASARQFNIDISDYNRACAET